MRFIVAMASAGMLIGSLSITSHAWGQDVETTDEPSSYGPPAGGPVWTGPDGTVLHDNGPLVTCAGCCSGNDESQVMLPLQTFGFGHQAPPTNNRVADDFIVPAGETWNVQQITFFAYQTNSPTSPSPITSVNYRIWNNPPGDVGSQVIFGDVTTNRLVSTTWAGIFRTAESGPCATSRPVMADVCTGGVILPPGTYWLDWQTGGALVSGPWAPAITVAGQQITGNGQQFLGTPGAWQPALDGTFPQGFPFIIEGSLVGEPEACCFTDGTCQDLVADDCTAQGGTPQGAGTDCAGTECPPPPVTGACCLTDGTCTVTTQADCDGQGGLYIGDGSDCGPPDPCKIPVEPSTWGRIKSTYSE